MVKFNVPEWDSLCQPKKSYLLTYLVSLGFSVADIGTKSGNTRNNGMLNYTINKQVHQKFSGD